ncbi:hypothetical protein [Streptomyces noursei]|uniref:hypothetical protein n=1 Tax=Streptomyces noursei TaxID=1971 RepID=UPI003DA33CBE
MSTRTEQTTTRSHLVAVQIGARRQGRKDPRPLLRGDGLVQRHGEHPLRRRRALGMQQPRLLRHRLGPPATAPATVR